MKRKSFKQARRSGKYILTASLCALFLNGQNSSAQEKEIFIPKDLKEYDLTQDTARWCYRHTLRTPNTIVFWEKGFGDNPANAPKLENHNMNVDLNNLTNKLEQFYTCYRDTLKFTKPGSKADKYRMMVMLNYSLEGTAYGGDYDNTIGALWISPNRVQDKRLNCIAHELGHSFQSQIGADGQGESWGGGGIFEMTSQWMLWQVNPEWVKDENFHLTAFMKLTHKAFLHMENIYHSPYVLEYWGVHHGLPFIAELFRQGKKGEDPVMTYQRITNTSQKDFCNELFDCYRHLVTFDEDRVREVCRPYAGTWPSAMTVKKGEWQTIAADKCPENYGFNIIELPVPQPGKKTKVEFEGLAGAEGYNKVNTEFAGWQYGFVAVDADGNTLYGSMSDKAKGAISMTSSKDKPLQKLWLVVMGAPQRHWMNPSPHFGHRHNKAQEEEKDAQWPYRIRLK